MQSLNCSCSVAVPPRHRLQPVTGLFVALMDEWKTRSWLKCLWLLDWKAIWPKKKPRWPEGERGSKIRVLELDATLRSRAR